MKWMIVIQACWSVALLVVGWLIGHRFGRITGISEGYGQCMLERRRRKSDMFSRMYGGPVQGSPSSISGGGFANGEGPERRSR